MRCNDIVGKHYYMAPEIVSQNFYDPMKADIWSLGVAVFILLTSSPPFEIATEKDQGFRFVRKHGIKAVFIAWQMQDTISTNTQDLIERMLTFDPNERISLEQILIHPALTTPSV
jgi:serine/threonine protein kinase